MMDDIEKLEHLSLVQKVVSELYNHTGLHEQVLGKLSNKKPKKPLYKLMPLL